MEVNRRGAGLSYERWRKRPPAIPNVIEETEVNKDQVKGAAKQVVGKVQEKTGKLSKSRKQQVKGAAKQAAGKVQKTYGDAREEGLDQEREEDRDR
jgi:uncharacterized protein YjbJ (UPF0337 family)